MKIRNIFVVPFFLCFFACTDNSPTVLSSDNVANTVDNKVTHHGAADQMLVFRYEITNKTTTLLNNAVVQLAAPVTQSPRHAIVTLDVNVKHTLSQDSLGNQTIVISFDKFAPLLTKIVTVRARISRFKKHLKKEANLQLFLSENKFVPHSHPELMIVAAKVRGKSDLETVSNSYQWVIGHMNYAGYVPNDHGALYALRMGKGDCTEYMYLLAALLRGNGIATKLVAGYVYDSNQLANAADYNNWVEVLVDGKWQVVDSQKQQLYGDANDYIAMRYLDSKQGIIQESQRFSASKLLTVKMY